MSSPKQWSVGAVNDKAQFLPLGGDEVDRDIRAVEGPKTDGSSLPGPAAISNLRKYTLFLAGLVSGCVLSILLRSLPSCNRNRLVIPSFGREPVDFLGHPPLCSPPSAFSTLDVKENIFISLTTAETISIRNWLMRPELALNLTRADEASIK